MVKISINLSCRFGGYSAYNETKMGMESYFVKFTFNTYEDDKKALPMIATLLEVDEKSFTNHGLTSFSKDIKCVFHYSNFEIIATFEACFGCYDEGISEIYKLIGLLNSNFENGRLSIDGESEMQFCDENKFEILLRKFYQNKYDFFLKVLDIGFVKSKPGIEFFNKRRRYILVSKLRSSFKIIPKAKQVLNKFKKPKD